MSTPTHADVFTDVVNSLMKEFHVIYRSDTIHRFITNNFDSPVLAEIHHLSLCELDTNNMESLLPALARMTGLISLTLSRCELSPDHLKYLFTECPALLNLQSIDLTAQELHSEDLLLLSQSTTLVNLTSLSLEGCRDLTTSRPATVLSQPSQEQTEDLSGLIALLSSRVVKNLTHLDLGSTHIDAPLLVHIAIATSPFLSNLASLNLSFNTIEPEAVTAFAASTTLANLTHLNLFDVSLGDELIAQLLSPPSILAQKLQSIDLSNANLTVSSLKMLSKAAPHLTELTLHGNDELGPAGAAFIASHLPNLTNLDLSWCSIKDEGYIALAASTTLTNLCELNLEYNEAQAESIVALVNSPLVTNLTSLDLTHTHHGPKVLTAIAQSPSLSRLQHLSCSNNEAGDEAIIAVAQSTILTNLTSLNLSKNCIGPEGITALCTSPAASKLTSLQLNWNRGLGNSVAMALAAPSSTLYSLIDLSLMGAGMGDEGVLQLLATPNLAQLHSLSLHDNEANGSTKTTYRARFNRSLQFDL